ncbi:MAG: N-6 DNA methylase [Pirellula sp.]|jgi:type I restriction enzyme M protein|nr:type I restriction-modification system subunit M [Pirellula sp.]
MANNNSETERRLWSAADEFRANSELKSSEYATPILGLIFLRYADHRFTQAEKELEGKGSGRRAIGKEDYQAKGVMYLPPKARFSYLLGLPEGENIGKAINEAMKAVEADNEELKGVLPKTYTKIDNLILASLLKNFSQIAVDAQGDKFGKIYEYFLGNFARAEGQRGGEFFTPTTMVQLIVEVIEPHHGRLMDHSCGSGGMYVQSAKFIKAHKHDPSREISIFGLERVEETRNLCLMNLAVHGLSGDIKQGNSYYEDLHESLGKFDFIMANPPFNVDKVDKEKIKDDPRFPFGMPRSDNANYLWIQLFFSSLNETGRAGFVMANSAADARQSEMEIRKALLQSHAVDVMIAIGPNFFYTVTLPCTLWFFDKGKAKTKRKDQVLFIDARHIYRQVDRAHRKFSPKQVEYLANIVRLYRGEQPEFMVKMKKSQAKTQI